MLSYTKAPDDPALKPLKAFHMRLLKTRRTLARRVIFRLSSLAAQAETLDQSTVARLILATDIVQQAAALGNHFQKATT